MGEKYKTAFIVAVIFLVVLIIILLNSYLNIKMDLKTNYIPYSNVAQLPPLSITGTTEFWLENKIMDEYFIIDFVDDGIKAGPQDVVEAFNEGYENYFKGEYACEQEFDKKKHYDLLNGNEVLLSFSSSGLASYFGSSETQTPIRKCWGEIIDKNRIDCVCYYATEIKDK